MKYSRKQKSQRPRRSKSYKRNHSRSYSDLQTGGTIISPSTYSNSNNAHFTGIGFTDPTGAVKGCTGGAAGNIYTTIGGIKTPVSMKGGRRHKRSCIKCNPYRYRCTCKNKSRTFRRVQRGGNTNGYSIGGVNLKPSLSGIATNYHTAYDSCKG
jgi:hypothetical protein